MLWQDVLRNPYGGGFPDDDESGVNPFGSGRIGEGPVPGKVKKKGTGMDWQDILSSGLHGAQNGGLVGAGASIGRDYLLNKYVKGGIGKALLSFL